MPSPLLCLLLILLTTLPSTYYIYNYPRINHCAWPNPSAPFRLLALADPQIEGDKKQKSWRGRIDIWGNDRYLRHIHRSVLQQVVPQATHEVVLGDLFGSQWIKDDEFLARVRRYKDIIFKDWLEGQMYGVDRFMNITGNHDIGYAGELNPERLGRWEEHFGPANFVHTLSIPNLPPLRIVLFNTLNLDSPATDKELQYNTYDFLESLLPETYEPIPQTILLTHLPLHKMPGICSDPPRFDYWSLNVTNNEGNVTGYWRPIKHQNHLSRWASDWILETIFGDHDEGIILNGHDHEGCDVLHRRLPEDEQDWTHEFIHDELRKREEIMSAGEEVFDERREHEVEGTHPLEISQHAAHVRNNISEGIWRAEKFTKEKNGIREITVRSMMGDFQGNVGLLAGDFNNDTNLWEFEYSTCIFLVQHWWWAVHIWDIFCIIWILGYLTRPFWWPYWYHSLRPKTEIWMDRGTEQLEIILEQWGLVTRGRKRQDTEQGGRKRM